MNHLSRVRETHSIARHSPQQQLARSRTFRGGSSHAGIPKESVSSLSGERFLLQSSEGEFVALWGQAAASVANNEHFEAILQRRERWEGHTGVILPDVHASAAR